MQFFLRGRFLIVCICFVVFYYLYPWCSTAKATLNTIQRPVSLHLRPGPASEPRSSVTPAAPHDPQQLPPDQVALRGIGDSTKGAAVSLL